MHAAPTLVGPPPDVAVTTPVEESEPDVAVAPPTPVAVVGGPLAVETPVEDELPVPTTVPVLPCPWPEPTPELSSPPPPVALGSKLLLPQPPKRARPSDEASRTETHSARVGRC
jgi:hypothetical protein